MNALRYIALVLLGFWGMLFLLLISVSILQSLNPSVEAEETSAGWDEVLSEISIGDGPKDYTEASYVGASSSTEATPVQLEDWMQDNSFVASNALFALVGLLGYALMIIALSKRRSRLWLPLVFLGVSGITFFGFFLLGFDIAYPGDHSGSGFLPSYHGPWFSLLLDDDPLGYGMGMSVWTDILYQGLYAVTVAITVLGLAAGSLRLWTVVPAACLTSLVGFPLVVSWHWGGGFLSGMNAYDFAGSATIHALAGGAGLALVLIARVFPSIGPFNASRGPGYVVRRKKRERTLSAQQAILWCLGAFVFFVLVIGVQAGSVLSNDSPVVASVLVSTNLAMIGGAIASLIVSFILRLRSRLVIAILGAFAGWAAICAPADIVTSGQSFGLGAFSGALCAVILWVFDKYDLDDPLGLVAVNLVGGVIGLVSTGFFVPDTVVLTQILFAFLSAAVGATLGGCAGLFGWMTGLLWTGEAVMESELVPDSA